MCIVFKLFIKNRFEDGIKIDFLDYLLNDIKNEILENTNMIKLQNNSINVLNADFIKWNSKPKHLDMDKVLDFIVNNIICENCGKGNYIIKFKNIKFLNSKNMLEQVVRFIDKGDFNSNPTLFISKHFNKYTQYVINNMWAKYIIFRRNMEEDI